MSLTLYPVVCDECGDRYLAYCTVDMQDREREHGLSCKGYYVDAPVYTPAVDGVWNLFREAWVVDEEWRATVWEYLYWLFGQREGQDRRVLFEGTGYVLK